MDRGGDGGIPARKDDHLAVAARESSLHAAGTGLRALRLRHRARRLHPSRVFLAANPVSCRRHP